MTDWEKVKTEYIRSDKSLQEIADDFGLSRKTVRTKSAAGTWSLLRAQYKQDLERSISEKVVESDAQKKIDRLERIADVADRLLLKLESALEQLDQTTVRSANKRKVARKGKDATGSYTETVTEERENIDVVKAPVDRLGVRQLASALRDLHDISRGVVDGDSDEVGVVVLAPVEDGK